MQVRFLFLPTFACDHFINRRLPHFALRRWKGLDPSDEAVLGFVKRNAITFYAAQRPQQDALVSASSRSIEEGE